MILNESNGASLFIIHEIFIPALWICWAVFVSFPDKSCSMTPVKPISRLFPPVSFLLDFLILCRLKILPSESCSDGYILAIPARRWATQQRRTASRELILTDKTTVMSSQRRKRSDKYAARLLGYEIDFSGISIASVAFATVPGASRRGG